ncbi:hypothetical protein [Hungatella hathewayi]|uniref:hypothetical protein n=1 Tax=Hungatella hathewayi TaxID=154046 RepID=UPI003565008D
MKIRNNILKYFLKNCIFINGTAYAGKSTMCKMLAKKYDLILCGENHGLDRLLQIITPEEYLAWIMGNSREAADFEIAELIRLSGDKRTIVDTNIPLEILKQIADYNQVAIMLSPQSLSVDMFFERDDEEKLFLLSQIKQAADPEKTLQNFRDCLAKFNSQEICDEWLNSGFFTIVRNDAETDTRLETIDVLARHFGL